MLDFCILSKNSIVGHQLPEITCGFFGILGRHDRLSRKNEITMECGEETVAKTRVG